MAVWSSVGGEYIDHYFDLFKLNPGESVGCNFAIYGNDEATMLSVAFSPNGRWLAASNKSSDLLLWNMNGYR